MAPDSTIPDEVQTQVTTLLGEIRGGDDRAAERLLDLVYAELRALAGAISRPSARSRTLQPTALVHEAWLKLAGNMGGANDRPHFFAIAARAMRQVLADHARSQRRLKRGAGAHKITLVEADSPGGTTEIDVVAFYDSLERLASLSDRQAKIVEMRLFGALTTAETARLLDVSESTVKSDWSMARAWLMRELIRF